MLTECVNSANMDDLARTEKDANKSALEAAKTVKTLLRLSSNLGG